VNSRIQGQKVGSEQRDREKEAENRADGLSIKNNLAERNDRNEGDEEKQRAREGQQFPLGEGRSNVMQRNEERKQR